MKILFDHPSPFVLAHGGQQIQIEETKRALQSLGVEVEWLRWWDQSQTADIIHFFGVPSTGYMERARAKGIRVVFTHLLSATCNRPDWKLRLQGLVTGLLLRIPGWGLVKNQLTWQSFLQAERIIVGLEAEKAALGLAFNVPAERVSVVPLGLIEPFLGCADGSRHGKHLITTGTIYEIKRSVEMAQMAIEADVPLLFVGKPYSEKAPYWQQFQSLIDGKIIMHRPHVEDRDEMLQLLGEARGFVLFSQFENWCLSAQEAIACGLPILVQDQKWSRERFGTGASYLLPNGSIGENAGRMRNFYDNCPKLPPPRIKMFTWGEVAGQLHEIYRALIP